MRKIEVSKWKARVPKEDGTFEEVDESLLTALNVLIATKKPEEMPKGLDKFRTFNRLSKAFDKAEESGTLELEEVDYKFLKDSIDSDVPSAWGMNENISKAIEDFLSAEEEK